MKIGILSDTHGRATMAARAVSLLELHAAEFLIHCGDVGDFHDNGIDVLRKLPRGKTAFVFGNNDLNQSELSEVAQECDLNCLGHFGILELAGRKIAVAHGDDGRILRKLMAQPVDYLLTGHTHVPHDLREGHVRKINPGALFRSRSKTVATLDLENDILTFLTVEDR